MNNKKIFIFTFVIFTLFLGIGLRAQETISHNFLFLLDQGRDMMAVKGIVYDHHFTLIGPDTSLRGVFQGPLWYYLLAIPTFILDGDPWGGVLLMLIISVSVIVVAYFWMRIFFGDIAAIITLFLFAISPEAAAAATYVWNPHPMWLLIVIYIFTFYSLITRSIKFNLVLWPLIGLMFNFQTALAVFIFAATVIYILIFNRKTLFSKYFIVGIILLFCAFLPQILFDFRHDLLMTRSILSIFGGSEQGLFVRGENQGYFDLVNSHLLSFYNNFRSAFVVEGYLKHFPNVAIGIIILAFLFVNKVKLFSKNEGVFISILTKLILIIFLLSFIYPFPIRYWFMTGFQSFYLIILGLILSKLYINSLGKVILILLLIVLVVNSLQRIDLLYFNPPNDGGAEKIKGKLKAIDFIYEDARGKPFGLLVFTPPVYAYAYDYLVWWYGNKKYKYLPYSDKKGIFYLLIEVDRSKQWSYKGWLETVIKTGIVLETTNLPSGLIVQKRSI